QLMYDTYDYEWNNHLVKTTSGTDNFTMVGMGTWAIGLNPIPNNSNLKPWVKKGNMIWDNSTGIDINLTHNNYILSNHQQFCTPPYYDIVNIGEAQSSYAVAPPLSAYTYNANNSGIEGIVIQAETGYDTSNCQFTTRQCRTDEN